jgi:hypothetical protein
MGFVCGFDLKKVETQAYSKVTAEIGVVFRISAAYDRSVLQ